jgi:hypothetical protein
MQELTNSIKRPNLRIMGLEDEEEVQAKGIYNIFNEIITENFPNLEKAMPFQVQEASSTPNRATQQTKIDQIDQNKTTQQHIIIKTTNTENRERTLKDVERKNKSHTKVYPSKS